ncbi:hypothetical protein [Saccharothrix coeruleofusca]|uniref:Uncharacterized protein n=1 Tax=Saccharothrix coeruleofusca TaxID=33919 RepID=A0A918ECW6_9PSEU|nr:hypothetical protein [Saccharothrix coeruleofusca]GGP43304.1 hypothetical protein GCM10010185_13600 [Saccharothrix coeruleofusca]
MTWLLPAPLWTWTDFNASAVALEGTVIRVAGAGLVVRERTRPVGMRKRKIPGEHAPDVYMNRRAVGTAAAAALDRLRPQK